jgi:hypothetical protein
MAKVVPLLHAAAKRRDVGRVRRVLTMLSADTDAV